jgi:hypothetical protein
MASKSETPDTKTTKPDTDRKDGPKVVSLEESTRYGYVGEVHPDKDNTAYTVAGVTGGTGNVADQPGRTSVDARAKWAPLQKP